MFYEIHISFSGSARTPRSPFFVVVDTIILCMHIDNQMKFKHAAAPFTYTLYAHAHNLKIYKNHMKNPVMSPF